jgi:hypothetical protein
MHGYGILFSYGTVIVCNNGLATVLKPLPYDQELARAEGASA